MVIEFFRSMYYWSVTGFAALACLFLFPCRVSGRENIPRKGGCIYASNHESNIDPILLPVVSPRQIRFLAKDSLFSHPVLGALIRLGGGIPLKRASADKGALKEALRQLELGWPILVFPQGTRGGTKPQPGVGFLAVKSGVPVVPVYIEGTARVLPKGSKIPRRTAVRVTFGKPVYFSAGTDSAVAADTIMKAIYSLDLSS
jgi:1-acyl-sn-glycerol-3-phosphate acyltransferase